MLLDPVIRRPSESFEKLHATELRLFRMELDRGDMSRSSAAQSARHSRRYRGNRRSSPKAARLSFARNRIRSETRAAISFVTAQSRPRPADMRHLRLVGTAENARCGLSPSQAPASEPSALPSNRNCMPRQCRDTARRPITRRWQRLDVMRSLSPRNAGIERTKRPVERSARHRQGRASLPQPRPVSKQFSAFTTERMFASRSPQR